MQLFDQFYKSWNFFTGCYTFANFFQTEGNGQDSAEFIDFRKHLLLHSKQNKTKIRTTRLFLVFMINLLVKQPQRGSKMKLSILKSSILNMPHFFWQQNMETYTQTRNPLHIDASLWLFY